MRTSHHQRQADRRADWTRWLMAGALIAGTLDIAYATGVSYLRSGVPPARILQSVASGLVGAGAYEGGASIAALGLGLHYLIAFIITVIFFAAAAKAPALVRNPLTTGPLYGIVVYGVMNYVVIPLSRIGVRPMPPASIFVSGLIVHMFCIGYPIAWAARRGLRRHAD